jgi:murein L,D-transpeptidase YcbB/YkuD
MFSVLSRILLRALFIVVGILLITGLSASALHATEMDSVLQTVSNEMRKQLTTSVSRRLEPELDIQRLLEFYEPRGFYPAWVDRYSPLPRAQILRQALQTADQDALDVKAYHPDLIARLWNTRSPTQLARLEILLTDAFFRYGVHLRAGQFQESDFHWDITPPDVDPVAELRYLLTVNDFQSALHDLAPFHAGYLRLREALKTYLQIEKEGGWPLMPEGPILRLDSWHKQVAILRQRLMAEGDLELGPEKNARFFDEAVKLAVERFQVRHGLKVDGVVGPETRTAANIPVSKRIKQIQFNMERWRWLPERLGQRYIMINTADFNLAVVENEVIQFAMGVIIGRPERPTPVTSSELHTVVFNPYWTLPPTIIFEDMLPQQRRDPTYFKSKQIRVFREGNELDSEEIDWTQVNRDNFPYILRQDPGPQNSLGQLKFLFSNTYFVYLHDTPDKHLFDRDRRALSSGCIRVEGPAQLASYLLGKENGWTVEKVKYAIESAEYLEVPIPESIPIYLVYMTAWVEENMGVHFRPDIYKRDPKGLKCDELPLN